ncbi:glycosyltransferase family 4 protein [Alteromonas facilis]|uniref:glycosyltransferase family 4 protein n=1 Tax=Alteromonas facilis TaxID=2048004 RepID=UPI000C282EB1|nr:glycosyltransferase family 4 protein [Alteromonas facilis]
MKILWLSHLVPYPPKGGVLQRSYNLLKEASKYHEVHLFAFIQRDLINTHFDNYDSGLETAKNELLKFCETVSFFDIPCERYKYGKQLLAIKSIFSSNPYTINWLNSDTFRLELTAFKGAHNIELVHYDTISLAPYLRLFKDTLAVLDHHNIESHMLLRRAEKSSNIFVKFYMWQEGKRLGKFESTWCPEFSLNITCSRLDSDRLRTFIPSAEVTEVENGVDISYFKPECESNGFSNLDSPRFIFVGRLNAYTNRAAVRCLVHEIWPLIHTKYPNAELDIVGAHPPEDIVRKSMEKDSGIVVHGFVDDVRHYIEKADIYLCPISDGGGTKLKILDALAMGKPIISNPIACEGINVSNGKNVLFADKPKDYVECVQHLIETPDKFKEMSNNAISLVKEQYSYLSIGKRLSQLYEKLSFKER